MIPVEHAVVFLFVVAALASVIMAMFSREVKQLVDEVTDWITARVRQVWGWVHHPKPKQYPLGALDPAVGSEWPKTDVREHVEKFNRAAATFVAAVNERQTMHDQSTTQGTVTRMVPEVRISWAVDVRTPALRSTTKMGEGIRVMIPRTPSDAESEAIDYGVVSETLTPDEAEAFAHGLLNLVATIRVEQRTPAVESKEQAF